MDKAGNKTYTLTVSADVVVQQTMQEISDKNNI